MRLIKLLLIAFISLILFLSCEKAENNDIPSFSLDEVPADRPFIVIHHYPAYPGPNDEVISGVIAAVWKDGRIMRIESESTIGKKYVEGRLHRDQMARVVHLLIEKGLTREGDDMPIEHDAASEHVFVGTDHRVIERAESLPRKIETSIGHLRSFLLTTPIGESVPLDGDWGMLPEEWRR